MAVFFMVLGCAFFAWITGRMTALLTSHSSCVQKFETTLDELNEYMEARDFPSALKERLRSFYMLKFPTKMIFDERSILDSLEAGLRKECYLHLYSDIVSHVVLFSLCDSHTQKEICYRLESMYRAAGSEIVTAGKPGEALFLVRFGVVEIFLGGRLLKSCYRGDLVGENALLGLTPDGKRSISAKTKTMSELCMLKTEDFNQLLLECPIFLQTVTRACEMHIEWLEACNDEDRQLPLREWLCVDWGRIGSEIKEERVREEKRDIHKMGNMATCKDVMQFEKKPLRTIVKLTLRDMYLVSLLESHRRKKGEAEPLPLCPSATSPRSGVRRDTLYVTVEWKGDPSFRSNDADTSKSAVQCESPLVVMPRTAEEALAQGRLEIMHTVDLMLVHNQANWNDLPPLLITVHRCPEDLGTSSGRLTQRKAFRKVDQIKREIADSHQKTAGDGPKEHVRDQVLYATTVSLKEIIEGRNAVDKGAIHVVLDPAHNGKLAEVGPLALNMTCRVTRKLWHDSRWFTVLQTLRNNHSSSFFKNKRRTFVKAVRRHTKEFFASIDARNMRLSTVRGWASEVKFKGSSSRNFESKGGVATDAETGKKRAEEFQTVMERIETLLIEVKAVRSETAQLHQRQERCEKAMQDCCSLLRDFPQMGAISTTYNHFDPLTQADGAFYSPNRSKRTPRAHTFSDSLVASDELASSRSWALLQGDGASMRTSVGTLRAPNDSARSSQRPNVAVARARPQLASELARVAAAADRKSLSSPLRSALSVAMEAREASAFAGARSVSVQNGELDGPATRYSRRQGKSPVKNAPGGPT